MSPGLLVLSESSVNDLTPAYFALSSRWMKRRLGFESQFAMFLMVIRAPVICCPCGTLTFETFQV